MATTYAGRVTTALANGLRAGTVATVFKRGSTTQKATLYADRNRIALANPIPTGVAPGTAGIDTAGTLLLFAEPSQTLDVQLRDANNLTTLVSLPVPADTDEPSTIALRFRGAYSAASVKYTAGDLVTSGGSLFLCTVSHVSNNATPDPTKFNV